MELRRKFIKCIVRLICGLLGIKYVLDVSEFVKVQTPLKLSRSGSRNPIFYGYGKPIFSTKDCGIIKATGKKKGIIKELWEDRLR